MPELGESVHEGTVSRWLKQIGDVVKEDEPIVEIMTDKVNTELPAPTSGTLVKITIPEGGQVEVFAEMGIIEEDPDKAAEMIAGSGSSAPAEKPKESEDAASAAPATARATEAAPSASSSTSGKRWFTPVVRAIAKENGLSEDQLASISGTGQGGRVTKNDVLAYLESNGATKQAAATAETSAKQPAPVAQPAQADPPKEFKASAPVEAGPDQEAVQLVGMRKMIADAMVRSSQIPVVSTLIEVDVTPLVEFRTANKDSFQNTHGVKLTYTPFFIKALAESLMKFPMLNASLQGDQILMNKGVHMGVAVSLGKDGEGGLIVPVIRDCHTKSLVEIARDLDSIAARARSNQLGVADVQGGTFTLTNPGSYGAVLGTPMINAPQAGIAGVYGISQRPVIVNGMIAIRSIMNVVLTYDHRLVDGLSAGRYLQDFKQKLESMDFFK
ncbi:dihydrolipoamide acetyltransferase family protein [Geitlerinema splendidum]|nr:dihydrolipoamide acetyltransferase family protein [Geitlerinema splendidum]